MTELRQLLASVPEVVVAPSAAILDGIEASVGYLGSDAALDSIADDTYWPKWNSPWWHMLLLFELGEAARIPERTVTRMIQGLEALPLKTFPLRPEELAGLDPHTAMTCHCALGCMVQILAACGVEVDRALPWARPWFVRYQMSDGGLNCDSDAYLVTDECPSSMVGTVAPLEAMLLGEPGRWTAPERAFVDRAAAFLIERRLMLGSPTRHNAEERVAAPTWLAPCFPRFYFYDVLRGLTALVTWAERCDTWLPAAAIEPVCTHLVTTFPDGAIRLGRDATAESMTRLRADDGTWTRRVPASRFPLLDAVSTVGAVSASATRQWAGTRAALLRLFDAGQIRV